MQKQSSKQNLTANLRRLCGLISVLQKFTLFVDQRLSCFCADLLRLGGGSSRCNGKLELKLGEWRPVHNYRWKVKDAAVICRELDCGSVVSVEWREEYSRTRMWVIKSYCDYSPSNLRDCVQAQGSFGTLMITCSGTSISSIIPDSHVSSLLLSVLTCYLLLVTL